MVWTKIDWLRGLDILTKIAGAMAAMASLWLLPKGVLALIRWRRSREEKRIIVTMTRERAEVFAMTEGKISELTHVRAPRVQNALFRLQEKGRVRFGNHGWNLVVPANSGCVSERFRGRFS
jgi:hypothetical protein